MCLHRSFFGLVSTSGLLVECFFLNIPILVTGTNSAKFELKLCWSIGCAIRGGHRRAIRSLHFPGRFLFNQRRRYRLGNIVVGLSQSHAFRTKEDTSKKRTEVSQPSHRRNSSKAELGSLYARNTFHQIKSFAYNSVYPQCNASDSSNN